MPGGRESPSPERLTDAQKNAPADGQGTDNTDNKQKNLKSELDVCSLDLGKHVVSVIADIET